MYFQNLTPQREGPIVKIHPDSESTLFKIPHLIAHTVLEVKNREVNFCPSPSRGSDLENTSRFGIYTIESPIFDTPHNGRGQNWSIFY